MSNPGNIWHVLISMLLRVEFSFKSSQIWTCQDFLCTVASLSSLNCVCKCEDFELTTAKYLWIFFLFVSLALRIFFPFLASLLLSVLVSSPTK